jgi:hypothetical protein
MKSRSCTLIVVCGLTLSACDMLARDGSPAPSASSAPLASSGQLEPTRLPMQLELDSMDTRTPVPLAPAMANHQKQNMRDHLLAVHDIVAALATSDFSAAERAAGRMGYSQQMEQMCHHMGAGTPAFTEVAMTFHHTADTIGAAAKRGDTGAVLAALGNTLASCTGCHATFKQQVVDLNQP